jgi:hypothetical protein
VEGVMSSIRVRRLGAEEMLEAMDQYNR